MKFGMKFAYFIQNRISSNIELLEVYGFLVIKQLTATMQDFPILVKFVYPIFW